MKYVQVNRTVEAHTECILLLYLSDANGKPVPNVKIKIWAGPPPTGQPPYYEDEEPDNLNRQTDSDGKFRFIVAYPTPAQPLDFYVQAVGHSGAPESEPVHFPFPRDEARWVIVTMAPESATDDLASEHLLATKTQPRHKLLTHYLLFGPGSQPGTPTNLNIALDYIIRYAPVAGFSPEEAKYAEHVTLVGDAADLSSTLEQSLRDAGCLVARLTASDSLTLETVFKHLIDSGSPYPTQ